MIDEQSGGKIMTTDDLVPLSIFEPTLCLRWCWVVGVKELQQLWLDRGNGDREWRAVPEVEL